MKAPRMATTIPGKKNTGVKRMMAPNLVDIPTKVSVALMTDCVRGPSIVRISWVHRAMMRAEGVSSSHLTSVE